MASEWDFLDNISDESFQRGGGDLVDVGGAGLSRSDAARARWNKMSNAERQAARKSLQKRGKWAGGKYAQKSQTQGGYPNGRA